MIHTIKSGKLTAQINDFGAELVSAVGADGYEYIWDGKEYWCHHAPVLFPTCGRIVNDTYTYAGKTYHMGFLAQNAAIATGAEAAIIPEDQTDVDQLATFIGRGVRKSKNSSIVLVSESKKDGTGGAQYYADRLVHEYPEFEARVTILGHLQRGGIPTAQDRILASRLGVAAIEALKDGQRNVMVGVKNDQIVYVPFNKAIRIDKPIDRELINVLNVLSI